MNFISLANFTASLIYVWLIIFVLSKNSKAVINRVCAMLIGCFVIWGFGSFFIQTSFTKNAAMLWNNIVSFGWCSFPSFYLWFSLILTKKKVILKRWYFYAIIFSIPALFIYTQWGGYQISGIIKVSYGWAPVLSTSIWLWLYYVYYLSFMIFSIYLCYSFGRKTKLIHEKKQTKIIAISSVITLFLASIADVLLPQLKIVIPGMASILVLIWTGGMVYAITRYRLLILTSEYAARDILATMTDSLVLIDLEGKIAETNNATLSLLGYKREEFMGKQADILFAGDEKLITQTLLFKTEEHKTFFKNGLIVNYRMKYLAKNKEEIPVDFSGSLMKEKTGDVVGIVCIARDMREIIKSEEQKEILQKKLLYSEKMAAVGQLAGGVAHEMNNPMGVILGFAQSIAKRIKEDDPLYIPLRSIEREAVRCKKLVGDLLTFSRSEKIQTEPIDINNTIDETLSLVEAQLKVNNIEIVKEYGTGLAHITTNKNQIQQVIVNLCNNAIDAMPNGGRMTVSTKQTGKQMEISISDTGRGMTEDVKKHLFEPFFTTKEVGKGAGLGLSICYEIIQKHHGTIEVENEINKGTAFIIKLPIG